MQHIEEVTILHTLPVSKENAGRKATSIDTLSMQQSATLSLSELLSNNSAIFIKEYGRGTMATASFRGTAPSHTEVLWNGMSINSPMLGMVDFSTVPVLFMDDVSLLHGSSSLSETSGALGGAILLNNQVSWEDGVRGKVTSSYGSYSTFDESAVLKVGNNKFQSVSRLFYSSSVNDFKYENKTILEPNADSTAWDQHPTVTNENADWTNWGVMQEFYYRLGEEDILSMHYWGQNTDRSIPMLESFEGGSQTNLPQINRQSDKSHRAVLEWKHYHSIFKTNVSAGINSMDMEYWLKTRANDHYNISIDSNSKAISTFVKAKGFVDFTESFSAELGLDMNRNNVSSYESVDAIGYDTIRTDYSVFAKINYEYKDRLFANFLLRQDLYGDDLSDLIPSLGLDFRVQEDGNSFVFLNVAKNYHAPTLNDLYYVPGGNPNLKTEKGLTFDAGLRYDYSFSSAFRLQGEASAYYSDIEDWIVWLPSQFGYWEPDNIDRVEAKGVELSLTSSGTFLHNLVYKILANYSYTSSINLGDPNHWGDESVGKQLPYIPKHSANITAFLAYNNFSFTYDWSYFSERYTTTSNEKDELGNTLYPYFMNDISLKHSWFLKKKQLDLTLKINNILNEDYRTVLYRPMPGVNYTIIASFRF